MSQQKLKIPAHVAFIVDGNRRWAKRRMLPTLEGHRRGVDNLEKVFDKAKELGVKACTAWVFSTENWSRTEEEVSYLMDLFREYIDKYTEKFLKEKTRFIHLGRKDRLSKDIVERLNNLEEKTKDFTDFTVALAMDYGGHDELMRAIKKLNEEGKEITEENIEAALDTKDLPNLDFIIRTGGERRLSGFMSWQNHYAEFYFPQEPFPAFTPDKFVEALEDYTKRDRRFGGDSKDKEKYLKK